VEQRFRAGDPVQTPLGKGVVREAGNSGRLTVEIRGRSVVLEEGTVAPLDTPKQPSRKKKPLSPAPAADSPTQRPAAEVDLHGLTVEDALARTERALNDALLADVPELRLIHGKSGGRIRVALHRRLREIPTVRAFRLDPRNPGVTIVSL
jgi:dsDNA-specific endonuclease/ATPase MutS2